MVLEVVAIAVGGELPLPDPDVEVAVGEAPERDGGVAVVVMCKVDEEVLREVVVTWLSEFFFFEVNNRSTAISFK